MTKVGAAQPTLSATLSNNLVYIKWSGSPFTLRETSDLSSGVWSNAVVPFTETVVNGNIVTTAVINPATAGEDKAVFTIKDTENISDGAAKEQTTD